MLLNKAKLRPSMLGRPSVKCEGSGIFTGRKMNVQGKKRKERLTEAITIISYGQWAWLLFSFFSLAVSLTLSSHLISHLSTPLFALYPSLSLFLHQTPFLSLSHYYYIVMEVMEELISYLLDANQLSRLLTVLLMTCRSLSLWVSLSLSECLSV